MIKERKKYEIWWERLTTRTVRLQPKKAESDCMMHVYFRYDRAWFAPIRKLWNLLKGLGKKKTVINFPTKINVPTFKNFPVSEIDIRDILTAQPMKNLTHVDVSVVVPVPLDHINVKLDIEKL